MLKFVVLAALAVVARGGVIAGPALGYAAAPALATPVYRQAAIAAPAYGYGGLGYAAAVPAVAKIAAPVAVAAPVVAKAVVEAPHPYDFGYSLQTEDGGSIQRQETSDAANQKTGSYGYTSPDGIYRHVEYIADAAGFRATIKTNEPGTAPQPAAATQLLAEEPPYKVLPAAAPVVKAVAAPIVAKAAIAAPVYAHAPAVASYGYAAPAVLKAPVASYGYAAPAVIKAPVASYGYAAAPAVLKAPVASYGYAAPALGYGYAPAVAKVAAVAAPTSVAYKTLHSSPAVAAVKTYY